MVKIVIPTLNAANDWPRFAQALLANVNPLQVLVLDSESTDGTPDLVRTAGFTLRTIRRAEFSHGGTRQLAAEMLTDAEILVYLTQDAVLATPDALENLVRPFEDSRIGAVCGRQLPRPGADEIEAHVREFNYPAQSHVRSLEDRTRMGVKVAFLSNSLAAYRRSTLMEVGGFPSQVILAEDMCVAGRMLLAGYRIAYSADACVFHSHPYTIAEEFKRYFDTGVMHRRERWLLEAFGSVSGEGKRFVLEQVRYLWQHRPLLIPSAVMRATAKWLAYQLGRREERIPLGLKRRMAMHVRYWD
jgi:rhamnosyltransferase